nr:hypothetical protein [Tanacetum cinerariifolium]
MAVHGNNGSIESLYRSSHSSTWLDIIQDFQQLKPKGMNLFSFIKKRIGNGEKSSFWEEVQVDMVGSFRRPPKGGVELQQYTCFRFILEDVILSNSQDRWLWSLTGSGEFSMASVRRFIDDYMLTDVSFKTKWLKVVPIKINIHAWKVKLDCLHTRFNLSRRELYRKIVIWWDIKLMEVDSFEGWTVWMSDIRLHGFRKEVTEGIFYITWWIVWKFRNSTLFSKNNPIKATLFNEVLERSFFWCRYRCKRNVSLIDWLKNPSLIIL